MCAGHQAQMVILSLLPPTPVMSPAATGLVWLRAPGQEALTSGKLGLDISSTHSKRHSDEHMGPGVSHSSHLSPQATWKDTGMENTFLS